MSKKTSEARKRAFFTALAETGNQTISAERARVSRSWVTLHRSSDPAFKARMEAATAEARAQLASVDALTPAGKSANINGETLVVRGTNGRRIQVARARLKQFTPDVERRFLRTLAATCNVKAACAEVGMTAAAAYIHRRKWPVFADRWNDALYIGYTRLEFELIRNAGNVLDGEPVDADAPIPPMTVDQVIQLLYLHERSVRGTGKAPGLRRQPTDIEAVKREIVRKAKVLEQHDAMKDAPLPDFMRE